QSGPVGIAVEGEDGVRAGEGGVEQADIRACGGQSAEPARAEVEGVGVIRFCDGRRRKIGSGPTGEGAEGEEFEVSLHRTESYLRVRLVKQIPRAIGTIRRRPRWQRTEGTMSRMGLIEN